MKKLHTRLAAASTLLFFAVFANAALEEVIVTATKRAESIQDVPVSVAAVGAEMMDKVGITDMEDLSIAVPNFEINSSSILPNLYIRGLGGGSTHSIEQSVGRFIDDVYIARSVINLHPFLDVAAVEVLRGPQGTLFGKNTAAGAMTIRTNDPTEDFQAGFNISHGEYDTTGGVTEVNGFISGPLTDTVAGRLAVIYKDREGYYKNLSNGPDGAQREDYGVQGKLKFNVSDATTVGLKLQYMEYEQEGSDTAEVPFVSTGNPAFADNPDAFWGDILGVNSGAPNAEQFTSGHDWIVFYNCGDAFSAPANGSVPIGSFCPSRDMETTNLTLDLEHELDAGNIKFVAGFQEYEYLHLFQALDGGLGNYVRAWREEKFDTFSTELRFTSEESEVFDYIAGIYYESSEIDRRQDTDRNQPNGFFARVHEPWTQETETFAAFGQARWHFTEKLTGIFGGRWSTETKDFNFEDFLTPYGTDSGEVTTVISLRSESRDEDRFTPSATFQYDLSEEVNVYVSASRGHKTGGFSDRVESQEADIEYDAEIIDGIEVGMKGSFLDNTMTLNLTYFHMDIEGLQLATQIEGTTEWAVDNAADSTSQGLEAELNWLIAENWTVGLNYAYTDATYDDFIGADNCEPDRRNSEGECDLSGATLIYAPENKGSVYVEYFAESALAGWDFGARVDVAHSGDHYTDVSLRNFTLTEAHETVGASLRMVSPDNKIILSLIGRNLGNEKINAWTGPAGPNSVSTMAAPRQVTLKVGLKF